MSRQTDDGVPVVSRVADGLERLLFAGWYRWFVRVLLVSVALLTVVHLARFLAGDALGLSAGAARTLDAVTSVVVTLFVLAGVVQVLVYARGLRRRETVVAAAAETIEESAETVETAAEELEDVVEDEGHEETPEDVAASVDAVEERVTDVQETVESVTEELESPAEDLESITDDRTAGAQEDEPGG